MDYGFSLGDICSLSSLVTFACVCVYLLDMDSSLVFESMDIKLIYKNMVAFSN